MRLPSFQSARSLPPPRTHLSPRAPPILRGPVGIPVLSLALVFFLKLLFSVPRSPIFSFIIFLSVPFFFYFLHFPLLHLFFIFSVSSNLTLAFNLALDHHSRPQLLSPALLSLPGKAPFFQTLDHARSSSLEPLQPVNAQVLRIICRKLRHHSLALSVGFRRRTLLFLFSILLFSSFSFILFSLLSCFS